MQNSICRAGLDRVQILATAKSQVRLPDFEGFRRLRDSFVRPQTKIKTYARAAEYTDIELGARVFLQHEPQLPTLPPFKATLVPNDQRLLGAEILERVADPFDSYRFSLLEIALDFSRASGINLAFVTRHTVFGKSQPASSRSYVGRAVYGGRKASKYVRCYRKTELDSFRIELEFHSAWLRQSGVRELHDLTKMPNLVCPSHIRFVRIDLVRLREHLLRRGCDADKIIGRMMAHSYSIQQAMQFLRTSARVHNVHRFLLTTAPTHLVLLSLKAWARQFRHF